MTDAPTEPIVEVECAGDDAPRITVPAEDAAAPECGALDVANTGSLDGLDPCTYDRGHDGAHSWA